MIYVGSVITVALHLWTGWSKTVNKPALAIGKQHKANVLTVGHSVTAMITLVLVACPIYSYCLVHTSYRDAIVQTNLTLPAAAAEL